MAKKNSNDQLPYLAIVGVVAVVAIVTLVLNGNGSLHGADIYQETVSEEDRTESCVDTDIDNDYYIKGSTSLGVIKNFDYCEGDNLFQYYCGSSNTVRLTPSYLCSNGCEQGACLN